MSGKKGNESQFRDLAKGSKEHRIKDAEDYRVHVDYLWNNPVRIRLADRAEDLPFSSAKLRDAVDEVPNWLKTSSMRLRAQSA